MKGVDNLNVPLDKEAMELFSITKAQSKEIFRLRGQIGDACVKEVQLLSEKHALERRFSHLRMALDEAQHDAITSSLKEMSRRQNDLEHNLKLAQEVQCVEDETYRFTTLMLSLLSEYGFQPNVLNALAISDGAKHLSDQLQWKIRTMQATISEKTSMIESQVEDDFSNKKRLSSYYLKDQLPKSTIQDTSYFHIPQVNEEAEPNHNVSLFVGGHDHVDIQDSKQEDGASYFAEESVLPGIEGFQILGDALPGSTLYASGYPVGGLSLCMFQWVHYLQDGTRQSIEGATNPDYEVTADDCGKFIAVECTPMNDKGHQGELVRLFANNRRKIACGGVDEPFCR